MTFPKLVGTAEIAEILGVSRQRVLQLAATPAFPQHVASLKVGKIWRESDVRAWMKATGRGP